MVDEQLMLLRRREMAWTVAAIAWGLGFFLAVFVEPHVDTHIAPIFVLVGWLATIYWIGLDARFRGLPAAGWVIFAVFLLPVALGIYLLTRPVGPFRCTQCGATLAAISSTCPNCGRPMSVFNRIFAQMTDSLAPGSLERAKQTARNLALTCIGLVFAEWAIHDVLPAWLQGFGGFVAVISFAAYWVLVPWWVYLDATWRRMETGWAHLALLTNIFGLVTYLVVRYPDPGACRSCGAYLTAGQKHCPYCGSEAGLTCPQCKAAIRSEWAYCPVCATQLTAPAAQPKKEQIPNCAQGIVTDAATGSPIAGAEVRVDSKSDAVKAVTDDCGKYRLENLEPRPYVLIASANGFEEATNAYKPGMAEVGFCLKPLPGG